ncbi:MAG: hypothetical protein QNJ97_12525 [Myxococcota bacterium]|nr:hypothetical protein [Myxococcota bacterium]
MMALRHVNLPYVLLSFLFIGCGGAQIREGADPLALLRQGRFAEARSVAEHRGVADPTMRAVVALSLVAETPKPSRGAKAVVALAEGTNEIGAAAAAVEMLDLAFTIEKPISTEAAMLISEAALGSVGYGPLKAETVPSLPPGMASRALGTAVLERVFFALDGSNAAVDLNRLLTIWNSCFTLGGGSAAAEDEVQAWRLFRSIGGLAVIVEGVAPDSDLSKVLLAAAVAVVESNPNIAIAARCDLASPFDQLKMAVAHNRNLLGRLEGAVVAATGCTRGTYAPEVR